MATSVDKLKFDLHYGRIERWDVYYIPRRVQFTAHLGPEVVEKAFHFRWSVAKVVSPKGRVLQSFLKALSETTMSPTDA